MKIYKGLENLPSKSRRSAITIGNFDGVHLGHTKIIQKLKDRANDVAAVSTLLTFAPHPQEVLHGRSPEMLTSLERKLELLELAGLDQVVVMRFTKALSQVEPEQFITDFLLGELRARAIVVGSNFRFGRFARGDTVMLRSFSRQHGFSFDGVGLRKLRGRTVSSTEIRHALAEGDLAWSNLALGRPHRLSGKVISGHGRGKPMGFPTANLRVIEGSCLPRKGIYAGRFTWSGGEKVAAISVGTNPTFSGKELSVEAYLLDYSGTIRGSASIELEVYLRPELVFQNVDDLKAAIAEDVRNVRTFLHLRRTSHT